MSAVLESPKFTACRETDTESPVEKLVALLDTVTQIGGGNWGLPDELPMFAVQ
jgi:hypothetical protein